MDYLRNLGSAAVSSLVQKSGLTLPFILGSKLSTPDSIYNLYDGTKREDGSSVSIFEYDLNDLTRKKLVPLAKNSLRKLRSTRHPDVLKFLDAVESDSTIYIMTERIRPLSHALQTWSSKRTKEQEDWLIWGLHRISVALAFTNDSCASTHGNLRLHSIFISPSGEWKLGGFEVLSSPKDESAVLYTMGGFLPDASSWECPEVRKSGWSVLKEQPPGAADAYALGLLLHAVFNPSQGPPPTLQPPHNPPIPSSRGAIPSNVFPAFKRLLNPNPKARLSVKAFLDLGMGQLAGEGASFFANNKLVQVCAGLDNFSIASEAEKTGLLRILQDSASSFPPEFASYKILPALISALEFGGVSAAVVLPLVLRLGKNVPTEDYPTAIVGPLVNLFARPDRGTRMALLEHLPEFADRLDKKAVVDKIWPHLQTGFTDTVAIIREMTVKSIILISPKLNDRILNNDLLRHLAKMQMDPEASIRTNTCILIGRLGPSLGYNTKRKVLVPAFTRAVKDPFVHARVAGLMAFMATIECFEVEELATKVIPNISSTLVDKEKLVRDQAFKAVDLFVKKLEVHAAKMPETVIMEGSGIVDSVPGQLGPDTLVNSAAGAAGALAGWAISSLGKTLVSTDMQTVMAPAGVERPTSGHAPFGNADLQSTPSPLTFSLSNPPQSSPFVVNQLNDLGAPSSGKGMQLGGHKALASTAIADDIAASEGPDGNPWGTDDLMDVNADEDDWSAFESAPAVVVAPKRASAIGLGLTSLATENGKSPPPAQVTGKSRQEPLSPSALGTDAWDLAATPPGSWIDSPAASNTSRPSPVQSPVHAEQEPKPSTAGISKEEKAAEMARRKEERKQRIAQLKEQKKSASNKPPRI